MENGPVTDEYPLQMVILHSYVEFADGIRFLIFFPQALPQMRRTSQPTRLAMVL
jgi:hypothetical protein